MTCDYRCKLILITDTPARMGHSKLSKLQGGGGERGGGGGGRGEGRGGEGEGGEVSYEMYTF